MAKIAVIKNNAWNPFLELTIDNIGILERKFDY